MFLNEFLAGDHHLKVEPTTDVTLLPFKPMVDLDQDRRPIWAPVSLLKPEEESASDSRKSVFGHHLIIEIAEIDQQQWLNLDLRVNPLQRWQVSPKVTQKVCDLRSGKHKSLLLPLGLVLVILMD